MRNLIRAEQELAQVGDVKTVISIDAPKVSTNCQTYLDKNLLGYYILINTWLHIVKQYSAYGWMRLWDAIHRDGLFALIARASTAADEVVHEIDVNDAIFRNIITDIHRTCGVDNTIPHGGDKRINLDPMAASLFVLRYPKRFSPLENDLIQKKSIEDFLRVENDSKMRQRRGYSPYLIGYVREEMEHLLDWNGLVVEIQKILSQPYSFDLPTGAGLGAGTSPCAKMKAVANTRPEEIMPIMGIPTTGSYPREDTVYWGKDNNFEVHQVDVRAVPKSYKASRIIAMEDTYRQSKAKVVQSVIDRFLPSAIRIHDQTQNQMLAKFGSWQGVLATVDLSHASDTITKSFAAEVFPRSFWDLVEPLLGTHLLVNDKCRIMQQMSTAGHALTFQLESMVFLAIYRAATRLYEIYSGEETYKGPLVFHTDYGMPVPAIYGDDGIVETRVFDTLVDVLTALGFQVNWDKSFAAGPYRESCGLEFWNGEDISGYYFPRFPIEGTLSATGVNITPKYRRDSYTGDLADSLTSLVSLQHRLYYACYPAAYFVYTVIKEAFPKMTTSSPGTDLGDCWDYEDTRSCRYVPAAEVQVTRHPKYKGLILGRTFKKLKVEEVLKRAKEIKPDTTLSEIDLTRFAKFRPGIRFTCNKEATPSELRLFDAYRYWEFLRKGPRYEDPLLELLGISAAPIKLEQFLGKPEVFWSLKEIAED
jgi:hypothetical protein